MRKVSKAIKEGKTYKTYAHCPACLENFIDDLPYHVSCPNGCPCLLVKGYEIHEVIELHEEVCLWDTMPETFPGSGTKIGMLSCPCPKCSPRC
jgi:hypothetical protein